MNMQTLSRFLWTLFIPLLASATAFAQDRAISGTVYDMGTGQPLAGVTVSYKTQTSVTDSMGSFHLNRLLPQATLRFTYVGYETTEYKLGSETAIRISMKKTDKSMDEVVVIGYGTVKKRDLTGSIYTVKAEDITRSPTSNPLEAVEGMVPGADITQSSGKANATPNIEIRGDRSINGSSTPLYIIDGIQGGNLNTLNPNDIESIEFLKDASSTAIYGSQGANGVIIVTTKKGTTGKVKVNYNGYYGVNGWIQYPEPRTGQSYLNLRRAANQQTGNWASPADDAKIFGAAYPAVEANQWVNWVNLVKQNGIRESHSVSVSGGSEKSKSYLSVGYFQDNGMVKANNLKQYNALLNLDQTISSWVRTGVQASLVYSNANTRSGDPYSLAETALPLGTPYNANGTVDVYPIAGNPASLSPLSDDRGPLIATNNSISTQAGFNAHVDLTPAPIPGLTLRSQFGANFYSTRSGSFFDSSSLEEVSNKLVTASVTNNNSHFYDWDNILTYNRQFGDHALTLTGVTSYTANYSETYTESGVGVIYNSQLFYSLQGTTPTNRTESSGYTQTNNMSYAGRLNYGYKGKYLLTLSERVDGASILSVGHKWAGFPSAAAAWRVSDEKFMEHVNPVSNLKLRLSYGVTGNSGIPAYGTQSYLVVQQMGFENTAAPAYIFNSTIGNQNVGWELSKTANLGLDMGFFKERLSMAVDLYNTNTDNILLLRSLPSSLGVVSAYQNVGSSQNRGIEVSVNSRNIDNRNFKWLTTVSFMSNRERITKLINGTNIISGTNAETMSLLLGHPIHSFYNYIKEGIWQTKDSVQASHLLNGTTPFKPGDIKLADLNHNGVISPDSDRTYIGSVEPKWSLGFQNTFIYKRFDLTIYAIARWGQMIQAGFLGRYDPEGISNGPANFNYWTPTHPTNDYPRAQANETLSGYLGNTTLQYVDGSYVKLKTATLGYTLPGSALKTAWMSNLRAYVTCNNIFVKAKSHLIKDYDPERGGAEDSPLSRQLVVGLNVGF
jgi:TonB-linked SusC/RagA family outer membrane protein